MKNSVNSSEAAGSKSGDGKQRGIYFPLILVCLYIVILIFNPDKAWKSLVASGQLFVKLIPVFLLVLLFMGLVNHFVNLKQIKRHVGKESGLKGWMIVIAAGVLCHGSIYMWFPFMKELREHGMRSGLVAVFLYNRAIKLPFLPLMVYYFGLKFVIVLSFYMVIASLIEGKIIELTGN